MAASALALAARTDESALRKVRLRARALCIVDAYAGRSAATKTASSVARRALGREHVTDARRRHLSHRQRRPGLKTTTALAVLCLVYGSNVRYTGRKIMTTTPRPRIPHLVACLGSLLLLAHCGGGSGGGGTGGSGGGGKAGAGGGAAGASSSGGSNGTARHRRKSRRRRGRYGGRWRARLVRRAVAARVVRRAAADAGDAVARRAVAAVRAVRPAAVALRAAVARQGRVARRGGSAGGARSGRGGRLGGRWRRIRSAVGGAGDGTLTRMRSPTSTRRIRSPATSRRSDGGRARSPRRRRPTRRRR